MSDKIPLIVYACSNGACDACSFNTTVECLLFVIEQQIVVDKEDYFTLDMEALTKLEAKLMKLDDGDLVTITDGDTRKKMGKQPSTAKNTIEIDFALWYRLNSILRVIVVQG
jgi:hypothetical protein